MKTIKLDEAIAFKKIFYIINFVTIAFIRFINSAAYFVSRCNRQILVVNFDAGGLMRNVPREVIY